MLKQLLLNKQAYNHISIACEQKNGRRGFPNLTNYYKDEDYIECNGASSFENLNNTFYK